MLEAAHLTQTEELQATLTVTEETLLAAQGRVGAQSDEIDYLKSELDVSRTTAQVDAHAHDSDLAERHSSIALLRDDLETHTLASADLRRTMDSLQQSFDGAQLESDALQLQAGG